MSGKFTLQIVSNQRSVNDKFVSDKLNIQLPLPTPPIRHLHISHNAPYLPPPLNLHNLCFSFLLGITAVLREIENNAFAKFWGANRVHYGGYASGVYVPTSSALDECLSKQVLHRTSLITRDAKKISKYDCTISFTTST